MSLPFDQKEDFRLRMSDLEKKLAESEEERSKLEKTCNVLMRAFREEEKMQYKALNKRYEKFLEDCTMRKRRNDIILRSLCRIEDRTKALFTKTERLKLLKDRYISYLKVNYVKNEKICLQTSKSFPFTIPSQNVTKDVTSTVKWTTPVETPKAVDFREVLGNSLSKIGSPIYSYIRDTRETQEVEINHDRCSITERNIFNRISNTEEPGTAAAHSTLNSIDTRFGFHDTETSSILKSFSRENEKLTDSVIKPGSSISEVHVLSDKSEFKSLRGNTSPRNEKTLDAVEKLKKVLSFEKSETHDESSDGQTEKEGDIQENKSQDAASPERRHHFAIPTSNKEKYSESKELKMMADSLEESDGLEKIWKTLPKGLDGVDYQNETYPESYYEQPVHHHNHTSIASDVILEEDETEQDLDEGMKEFGSDESETNPNLMQEEMDNETKTNFLESRGVDENVDEKYEENKEIEELSKGVINEKVAEKAKSLDSDSEISPEAKQSEDKSEKSEKLAMESSNKNKMATKSNLSHLLESDSESFQIEHGDAVSGNEDSDFDFSFHQK